MTHEPIPAPEMVRLARALRTAAGGEPITLAVVARVAEEEGAPVAHVYAAMAMDPNMAPAKESDVLVAVCVGSCQAQGAVPVLEALLETRGERLAAGQGAFDVLPRSCLDLCSHSPVCMTRTPQAMKAHPRMTPDEVRALMAEICDA
jgi:NADH:ubiquinone oxidoreductase subunit E